jgi:hypothetical protein
LDLGPIGRRRDQSEKLKLEYRNPKQNPIVETMEEWNDKRLEN